MPQLVECTTSAQVIGSMLTAWSLLGILCLPLYLPLPCLCSTEREREKETERQRYRERQRDRDRHTHTEYDREGREGRERIPSRLCAVSMEPDARLELTNCEIMT